MANIIDMGFAENVKSELSYQGILVKELAEKTGISKNTLDKYLSGQNVQPGVENAVKIAKALGVTVEVLLGIEKNTNRNLPEYQSLIEQYKSLNAFNKRTVQDLIKSLSDRK